MLHSHSKIAAKLLCQGFVLVMLGMSTACGTSTSQSSGSSAVAGDQSKLYFASDLAAFKEKAGGIGPGQQSDIFRVSSSNHILTVDDITGYGFARTHMTLNLISGELYVGGLKLMPPDKGGSFSSYRGWLVTMQNGIDVVNIPVIKRPGFRRQCPSIKIISAKE